MKARKGQAIIELGIFGTIILFVVGMLISYIQRQNDQQYVQMEAFRGALQKACQGPVGLEQTFTEDSFRNTNPLELLYPGKGAAVQYTVLENRRYVDVSPEFVKKSPQVASASSNVYWAVPFVGKASESLTAIKINEDKPIIINSNGPLGVFAQIPEHTDGRISLSFQAGEIESDSESAYIERTRKQEDTNKIINTRSSQLQENVHTTVKYKVKIGASAVNEAVGDLGVPTEITISEGTLADITQGLYRDSDGQYKYRKSSVGNVVERQKQWETPFVR